MGQVFASRTGESFLRFITHDAKPPFCKIPGGVGPPPGISIAEGGEKRKKEVQTMSEKEKKIIVTIAKAVKSASEQKKEYLLGWAEGAAFTLCGPAAAERPGA